MITAAIGPFLLALTIRTVGIARAPSLGQRAPNTSIQKAAEAIDLKDFRSVDFIYSHTEAMYGTTIHLALI